MAKSPTHSKISTEAPLMPKNWTVNPRLDDDLIEHLLKSRGIKTAKQHELFFNPERSDFKKDLNIAGIDEANKLIETAIKKQQLIIVYGDYDVDGICATAIGYLTLAAKGAKVLPYIPHREKEGYGLSKTGLNWAKEQGATLIITVDHGIVAFEQVEYAKSLGLKIIVSDHHVATDKMPVADAIVHSTEMCGAGVAWCLFKAEDLLELVAIATICDMMSLTGVNRWFVKEGLKQLQQTKRIGLLALFRQAEIPFEDVTPYHIGHILGPRLNAMGRLEHAIDSLRLICTNNPAQASRLAILLHDTNSLKKQLTNDAIYQAKILADQLIEDGQKKILVLHSKDWIPGIIGLIAARLADEYQLPTIIIAEGESQSKASARTAQGINMIETIRLCSDLLIDVGGHPAAAGFTITTENINQFIVKINQVIMTSDKIKDELLIDGEVLTSDINRQLYNRLSDLEPFGLGNEKPVFASMSAKPSDIKSVGEGGKHLKLKVDGIDAIAFGFGQLAGLLNNQSTINVAYCLELNKFNGRETLQLNIVDIKT